MAYKGLDFTDRLDAQYKELRLSMANKYGEDSTLRVSLHSECFATTNQCDQVYTSSSAFFESEPFTYVASVFSEYNYAFARLI